MILFSDIGLSQSELNRIENQIKTFEKNINNLNKIKTDFENTINEMKLINKNNSIYDDNLENNYKEYYISCLNLINKQLEQIENINFSNSYKFDYNNNKFLIKKDKKILLKKFLNNIEKNKKYSSPFKYLKNTLSDSEIFIYEPGSLSSMSIKRIKTELIDYYKSECSGFFIFSFIDNELRGVIEGPPNTPYENCIFFFLMKYSSEYPFKPPKFLLNSKIYHPNIDSNGNVSIDILRNDWTMTLTLRTILLSIQSLLDDPNPDDFLNEEATKLYRKNKEEYNIKVRNYTKQNANYDIFKRILITNEGNFIFK